MMMVMKEKNERKVPTNTIRIRHGYTSSHLVLPISKQAAHLYFLLLVTHPKTMTTLQEFTCGSNMNFSAKTDPLHAEAQWLVLYSSLV